MSPLDGRDVLQGLQNNQFTRHIPVILVTASVQEHDIEELQPLVQGFLRKPVSQEAIAQALHNLFGTVDLPPTPPIFHEQPLPNSSSSDASDLSAEAKERLPELLHLLQLEEEAVWQTLHQSLLIDQLRIFAARLQSWAIAYEYSVLQDYVLALMDQLDRFDLVHLPETVAEFPKLKVALQQLLESE